jgi:hypothetical protein
MCLERGFGVKCDPENAAKFYRIAAARGHADGANNLGLCLEHGIGVPQNIPEARRYYSAALKLNHPEADVNYRRCCRLLGEWSPPARSPTQENLTDESFERCRSITPPPDLFFPPFRGPRSTADLHLSLNPATVARLCADNRPGQLSVHETPDGVRTALKVIRSDTVLEREIAYIAQFQHPCVLETLKIAPIPEFQSAIVLTELIENGALHENIRGESPRLRSPTKIAKIAAGIALAMRFMHARNCTHGHLKPANILLDRKWRVRIADFGSSRFARDTRSAAGTAGDPHYLPPERFAGCAPSADCDVYAFGLILFELALGEPPLPPDLEPLRAMRRVLLGPMLAMPPDADPRIVRLIFRCCADNRDNRPDFDEIVTILKGMKFKIRAGVKEEKVLEFVGQIEGWEDRRIAFLDGEAEEGGRSQ